MIDQIKRAIEPLQRRVRLMIARAVLDLVDDAAGRQTLQFHLYGGGDLHDRVERFQQYGFTSVPFPSAEAIVLFPSGERSHGIAIAVEDRRYRLKALAGGEVALYDDLGQKVHLHRNGIHAYTPKTLRIEGDIVEIVAHTALRHDVHGYADELRWYQGTDWTQTDWHEGATVTPASNPIDPPEHFHGP